MAALHLGDLALGGLRLVGDQLGDGAEVGEVLVAAREVEQHVGGGGQAEAREQVAAARGDAGDLFDRGE